MELVLILFQLYNLTNFQHIYVIKKMYDYILCTTYLIVQPKNVPYLNMLILKHVILMLRDTFSRHD